MKVSQHIRAVENLIAEKDRINLNPMWQRGAVWTPPKQSLLIDSILRQMDVPKLYLLRCAAGSPFGFEAIDGQQRLRALFSFRSNQLQLVFPNPSAEIDGFLLQGVRYRDLPQPLKDQFDKFELSVAEVEPTDYDDVRRLFLRLQMGVLLNPAELRNAQPGPLRQMVDLIATTHPFFTASRIGDKRFKRQDYLAHVFALLASPGSTDLKAPDLLRAYETMSAGTVTDLARQISDVLDILGTVDALNTSKITQKWIFVDLAWLISDGLNEGGLVDGIRLATLYAQFDRRRKAATKTPEALLEGTPSALDRALYRYIVNFASEGADKTRLNARHDAMKTLFADMGGTH